MRCERGRIKAKALADKAAGGNSTLKADRNKVHRFKCKVSLSHSDLSSRRAATRKRADGL